MVDWPSLMRSGFAASSLVAAGIALGWTGAVSVEGAPVPLPQPFFVLATRNPIEFHGTFPVPEAALDRFQLRVALDYPEAEAELALYLGRRPEEALAEYRQALASDPERTDLKARFLDPVGLGDEAVGDAEVFAVAEAV